MSFVKRAIDVTITLGEGAFGDTVGDTVTLRGHRVTFEASYNGGFCQTKAHVRVYGLPLEMINRLTTIGPVANEVLGQNLLAVAAGNEGEALTTIFNGHIWSAYGDFQETPDVPLVIVGYAGMLAAIKPVGASSYVGTINAGDVMADFAEEMDFSFENNGVSVSLSNPYFSGCTLTKIQECAQEAGIKYSIDNKTLAIWPKTGHRHQDTIPEISPDTGMIGYPIFGGSTLGVKCLFRPELIQGGLFRINGSQVVKANGAWSIYGVTHSLASQMPNGNWFTELAAYMDLNASP